jgi:tetratricopeptide (TPR) repeat protein
MQITTLFNALSFLYLLRSLKVAHTVWQQWPELKKQGSLTSEQKGLIEQASFYLAVPVGVLLHELAHAFTIWLFGGRVVEFGYRFFWGFVRPDRLFTPTQEWVIAIAGTLGSLLFGLALWLLFRSGRAPAWSHFGLYTFRYQLIFSLVFYPIFTIFSLFGDWRTIYDFQATPLLSGFTLVAHLGLLGWTWWADRRGWFERALATAHRNRPGETAVHPQFDDGQQLAQIRTLQEAGATNQALHQLKAYLQRNPHSAEAHLLMALLQSQQARPSSATVEHAQKALSLGLPDQAQEALAYQVIGQYRLHRERVAEAIQSFNQGLAAVTGADQPLRQAQLHYFRAIAYRRQHRYEDAYQDIEQAIRLAETPELEQLLKRYQMEREIIERHAGRPLGPTPAGA